MSAPWLRNNTAASSASNAASVWSEHVANDNRTYYWNSETKTSSWERPDVLKTAEERAAESGKANGDGGEKLEDWKEYETADGQKYYHNLVSNTTTWDKPDVLVVAEKAQQAKEQAELETQTHGRFDENADDDERMYQELERADRITVVGADGKAISAAAYALTDAAVPVFKTVEQAEDAFSRMLRKIGVQPDWSWEQTIRAAVRDPVWRALPDSVARKAAFERYLIDVKKATIGKQKDRIEKLRRDFDLMLRRHDEIKSYSRWKNVKGNLEGEVAYKAAIDDEEREALFDTYIEQLGEREIQEEKLKKRAASNAFIELLKVLRIDLSTPWRDARGIISESEEFAKGLKFKGMQQVDKLMAFEDYVRELERSHSNQLRIEKALKHRRERKNREAFIELLSQMRSEGTIHAGVKWKVIHPLIKNDPIYLGMLGQSGSSPLDLFWDLLEELDQDLRAKKALVLEVLDFKRQTVSIDTTFEAFQSIMHSDNRTSHMSEQSLMFIYEQLMEKARRRIEEENKAEERRVRRKQDDLRSAMKKLDPPIGISDTYESTRIRISMLAEFTALNSEDAREGAFNKYIRRLKERLEEEEERSSRRDRHTHRRTSRDRRHERERRSSRDSRRSPMEDRDPHDARRRRTERRGSIEYDPRSPKRIRKDSIGRGDRPNTVQESGLAYGDKAKTQPEVPKVAEVDLPHKGAAAPEAKMEDVDDGSSEEGEIAE